MFKLFRRKLSEKEQAEKRLMEIYAQYLAFQNPVPEPSPKSEAEKQMEKYFTVKNDILRFNMSRCSGVLDEGNNFDR